jgi:tripartite-type tricarboxylate transporter receptor subunit TctC
MSRICTLCITLLVAAGPALAQSEASVADFYRGKAINVMIGHEAGTGYDFFGRALARHIGPHIPGSSSVVPQNMAGAGGMRAANWLYNVAARDGTVLAIFAPETALKPIFGDPAANYRAERFTWIGNMDEGVATCAVSARSGITSLDQLLTRDAVFGATGVAAPTSKFVYALINFVGARIKVVQGYKGTNDLRIALGRGEIEGACGQSLSTLQTQWKAEIDSGSIRPLVQFGLQKVPELAGVAHIYDYAKSAADHQVFDIVFGTHVLGRPVIAPPDIPADRVRALRTAFMRTMQDTQLSSELAKLGLQVRPASGNDVEALVRRFASVPKHVIERAVAATSERR